jgi:hypothetical protein
MNGPGIRLGDAVDDLHQRAFAGTILAQHRVNFARAHAQGNVISLATTLGYRLVMPVSTLWEPISQRLHKPDIGIGSLNLTKTRCRCAYRSWNIGADRRVRHQSVSGVHPTKSSTDRAQRGWCWHSQILDKRRAIYSQ